MSLISYLAKNWRESNSHKMFTNFPLGVKTLSLSAFRPSGLGFGAKDEKFT